MENVRYRHISSKMLEAMKKRRERERNEEISLEMELILY